LSNFNILFFLSICFFLSLSTRRVGELSPPEKRIFAALYDWRDKIARLEDESTGYVLPNKMLLSLSRAMPQSINDMSSCIHPIPEIVRKYATDVLDLIINFSK